MSRLGAFSVARVSKNAWDRPMRIITALETYFVLQVRRDLLGGGGMTNCSWRGFWYTKKLISPQTNTEMFFADLQAIS
jgi:hypothetical protein